MSWNLIQKEIGECHECNRRWPRYLTNTIQLGEIPAPPNSIRILFIGVAPTALNGKNKGTHFYTSYKDNLRRGLFRLLQPHIKTSLKGLNLDQENKIFHDHNFFFVHAGKARPIKQNAPPIASIEYCTQQHLKNEIFHLNPKSICFLGKTNLKKPSEALFGIKIDDRPKMTSLGHWSGWVSLSPQPIRGWEKMTVSTLKSLLKLTDEKISL